MTGWKRFENTDIETLINLFQANKTVDLDRDDAFLAICFRFRQDLLNKCEKNCSYRGYDIEVAQQITEETFRAYGKSKVFKVENCNQSNVEICFKLYLYKISSNLLNDYYKIEEKRKKGQLYDGTEGLITKLPNIELHDIESKIIHETLSELPYSHQVIYMTYTAYEKMGVYLPRVLQAQIREHLGGIEQVTVRGYKKEAIDKIENAKNIISKLKSTT